MESKSDTSNEAMRQQPYFWSTEPGKELKTVLLSSVISSPRFSNKSGFWKILPESHWGKFKFAGGFADRGSWPLYNRYYRRKDVRWTRVTRPYTGRSSLWLDTTSVLICYCAGKPVGLKSILSFYQFTGVITHAGSWEKTRKVWKATWSRFCNTRCIALFSQRIA